MTKTFKLAGLAALLLAALNANATSYDINAGFADGTSLVGTVDYNGALDNVVASSNAFDSFSFSYLDANGALIGSLVSDAATHQSSSYHYYSSANESDFTFGNGMANSLYVGLNAVGKLTSDSSGDLLTLTFGNVNLFDGVTQYQSLAFNVTDFNVNTFALSSNAASAVPEPEAYAMMLAGLGLVGFAARKRKS